MISCSTSGQLITSGPPTGFTLMPTTSALKKSRQAEQIRRTSQLQHAVAKDLGDGLRLNLPSMMQSDVRPPPPGRGRGRAWPTAGRCFRSGLRVERELADGQPCRDCSEQPFATGESPSGEHARHSRTLNQKAQVRNVASQVRGCISGPPVRFHGRVAGGTFCWPTERPCPTFVGRRLGNHAAGGQAAAPWVMWRSPSTRRRAQATRGGREKRRPTGPNGSADLPLARADLSTKSSVGKKLDAYQWVLFVSAHCERHANESTR